MRKSKQWLRDGAMTVLILGLCFAASILMQEVAGIPEQVTTIFAFAVFLISLLTDGYLFGLAAAGASVLLVNYAFTFPYFALDFNIPANFFSAMVMAVIAVFTGALTTKIKEQEALKAEHQKERMRANLLRAVSHDLRTPLTTIYGSVTALRENGDILSQEQQDQMLLGIQEDTQWLMRMVENLLSVTRMDGDSVKLNMSPTALDELLDSVLMKFRKRYPQQPVELCLPEELIMIPMDALLVEQVLINLLENAVQHATGMTHLTLSVAQEQELAIFTVTDDGCGIPPEKIPHLFSGTIGTAPNQDIGRNAGIGLSLCASIIRAHGGTIRAEQLPQGTAFHFTLKTEDTADE